MQSKPFHAYHLTEQLKLTSVLDLFPEKPFRASGTELVYRFEKDQYLIIYNFGAMVFFNVDPAREEQFLHTARKFVSPKDEIVTSEEFHLEDEGKPVVEFRKVVVDRVTFEKIELIALVLAQSTALDYFEHLANDILKKSGSITEILEKKGTIGRKDRELIQFIGLCLNTKQKVITSTYLLDNPDPTWESQTLESLYKQMADMFELRERYLTLEYKLKMVQETVEILTDLSHSRRMWFLEVSILLLIALETALFIWQLMSANTSH